MVENMGPTYIRESNTPCPSGGKHNLGKTPIGYCQQVAPACLDLHFLPARPVALTSRLLPAWVRLPSLRLPVLPDQVITSHLLAIYGTTLYGVEDGLCFLMQK